MVLNLNLKIVELLKLYYDLANFDREPYDYE